MLSETNAVEELLGRASPRPMPPAEVERCVREAVHAEWQAVSGRRVMRRRIMTLAAAAAVVLAVAMMFNTLRTGVVEAPRVATVEKSFGSVYILGEQSELREMRDRFELSAGQTVVTGSKSGIGLTWESGGSLRIDQNTRIEIVSASNIRLQSGRVYFDSKPSELIAGISAGSIETSVASTGSGRTTAEFEIETPHGVVRHIGTQYMTYVDNALLSVSVREGQVSIDGLRFSETAVEGQQLTVAGDNRPTVVNFSGHGDSWQWIEATSPAANLDGRSVFEFLSWVCRETGLRLKFDGDAAEQLARSAQLRGTVDTEPRNALRLYAGSVDLDWRIEGGYLYVNEIDLGTNRY